MTIIGSKCRRSMRIFRNRLRNVCFSRKRTFRSLRADLGYEKNLSPDLRISSTQDSSLQKFDQLDCTSNGESKVIGRITKSIRQADYGTLPEIGIARDAVTEYQRNIIGACLRVVLNSIEKEPIAAHRNVRCSTGIRRCKRNKGL